MGRRGLFWIGRGVDGRGTQRGSLRGFGWFTAVLVSMDELGPEKALLVLCLETVHCPSQGWGVRLGSDWE